MKYLKIKRFADFMLSLMALIVLSPLFIIVGLVIFLDDGLPVIFSQERSGANRTLFTIYKFRSMPKNAANVESRDARTLVKTRVGSFLRRANLDELPQLYNVLKGDMSLIGPRPALPSQTGLLKLREKNGSTRLAPGLTGLAQVNGYDDMPDSEKAEFDGTYAANINAWQDFTIILKTVGYLLKRPPVY